MIEAKIILLFFKSFLLPNKRTDIFLCSYFAESAPIFFTSALSLKIRAAELRQ